jgi:fatty-acyl-CoA synthase
MSRNCSEFVEACFSLAKLGVVTVPINWRLSPIEFEQVCVHSDLKGLIFGADFTESVEAMRRKIALKQLVCIGSEAPRWATNANFIADYPSDEPKLAAAGEDPLLIQYTSGTTGPPKGVVLTHQNIFWWCNQWIVTLDFRPDDRGLVVLPMIHAFGLAWTIAQVLRGCASILMSSFDPKVALETIQEQKVTIFPAVPTMVQLIAYVPSFEKYMSTIRWIYSGGAPVPVSLIQTYAAHGLKIVHAYAGTEFGPGTALETDKSIEKCKSVGVPFLYIDVRVVDEQGFDVKPGQVGEVIVKGPGVVSRYWKNPEATAKAIVNGWVHTGDLARLDEKGYMYVVDRMKDTIISGAEKVYPNEIEDLLLTHPKVADAAVIGQPDEIWGETVTAVVQPKAGEKITDSEVLDFCQGKLARYEIPKRIIITDDPLPRNVSGKLLRRVIRERLNRP